MIVDVQDAKKYLTNETTIFRKGKKDVIVCDFERIFNLDKPNLNVFFIPRPAFYKRGDLFCDTLNIFNEYYDEDKEFITCLIHMKAMCDLNNMKYPFKSFLDDLVNRLFSPSMVAKIEFFVEDQYRIDLEQSASEEDKEKYKDNPHQFTNEHGKILMSISTAIKMCIPIVCHYYAIHGNDMDEEMLLKKYLYTCFYSLFPLFEKQTNIYNKLYATVDKQVTNTEYSDAGMWTRNKNKGITPTVEKIRIAKMLVQDIIYKYEFNAVMIFLNFASIRRTIRNTIVGKDTHDFSDINMKSSDTKMSGLDQLEMTAARVDERDIIISSRGASTKVKHLLKKYKMNISDDELNFYIENLDLSETQIRIITQFFADDFGGTRNMEAIQRDDFYRLLIIMKKELRHRGFSAIPELISGKQSNKIKGRKMSFKKLNKVKSVPRFYNLMKHYKDVEHSVNENLVMIYISFFINVALTSVEYGQEDRLDEDISINENLIIDETIRLVEMF